MVNSRPSTPARCVAFASRTRTVALPDQGARLFLLPLTEADLELAAVGAVSEIGRSPAVAGDFVWGARVTVAEPALVQACLGAFFGRRGSPSVLRGSIFTAWPDSGFSDGGTFARLLAAAL